MSGDPEATRAKLPAEIANTVDAPVWRQLVPLISHAHRRLGLLALFSTVSGVLEAAVLIIVVNSALAATSSPATGTITLPLLGSGLSIATCLVFAGLSTGGLMLSHTVVASLSARTSTDVLNQVRLRAIRAYLNASWADQATSREGSLQETTSTLATHASALAIYFATALVSAMSLAMLVLAAAFVSPASMLAVAVVGGILSAAVRPLTRVTHRRASSFVASNSLFNEDVSRMTNMVLELKVFGSEDAAFRSLERTTNEVTELQRRTRFVTSFGALVYKDLALTLLVGAVAFLYLSDTTNFAEIGAVVLLAVRSLAYASSFQSSMQQMREFSPNLASSIARIQHLENSKESFGSREISSVKKLEFKDVIYSYDNGAINALDHVDISVREGEMLGVVGSSGSGKSTFLQVMLRLRHPTSGEVLVDGVTYQDFSSASWRKVFAFVPQDPILIEGTILENLIFFRDDVSADDAIRAADSARIGEEIRNLPQGFGTILGPRGIGLSGGQRQRVAIARALAGQPKVLALDEPTSALDGTSDLRIRDTLAQLKGLVTIVLVSHRVAGLEICDRLISFEHGRVRTVEHVPLHE